MSNSLQSHFSFQVLPVLVGLRLDKAIAMFIANQTLNQTSDPEINKIEQQASTQAIHYADVSRETIKKAIKNGFCQINGQIQTDAAWKLKLDDEVNLELTQASSQLVPEEGSLEIIYRDQELVIINKNPGLTVHPAPSCPQGTLVHQLITHFPELLAMEGQRPGIVHRLDKDTSGLICIALNEGTRLNLSAAFAEREVHKEYMSMVWGNAPAHGVSEEPLGRDPKSKLKVAVVKHGKPALTEWTKLFTGTDGKYSLLRVKIHTGRTHQIRVHLAQAGFPIIGDTLYGSKQKDLALSQHLPPNSLRQLLHAYALSFSHPKTSENMSFTCPPLPDFLQAALVLQAKPQKVVVTGIAGCGKSSFVQLLAEQGIPIWSADAAVARLYVPGGAAWERLRYAYGDQFIPDANSPVDKRKLGEAVVKPGSGITLEDLESILHPLLKDELESFWTAQTQISSPLAVAEVPLWFELGWHKLDGIITVVVQCQEVERHQRLQEIRNWSEEFRTKIDSKQWSQSKKMTHANKVIPNLGELHHLKAQADLFIQQMHLEKQQAEAKFCQDWAIFFQN